MSEGLNAAERFIFQLCRSSFLRLWSYANPQGKDPGKELCDVLVVCPPDVIIFSVKDVALKHGSRPEIGWSRWRKKAVEDSAKQIYGAERHISPWQNTPFQAARSIGVASGAPAESRTFAGNLLKTTPRAPHNRPKAAQDANTSPKTDTFVLFLASASPRGVPAPSLPLIAIDKLNAPT